MNIISFSKKSGTEITIIFIKISIIAFFSFYFLSNFQPYYEGADSYVNALTSIKITQGSYEITNPLLQQTGLHEFVPRQWVITESNTAVPAFNVGLPVIGSIFYSLFGYYGLFYLIPLCSISLLIISERISTKLFGSLGGLITLILVSSNLFIIRTGTDFLSENISTIFILIAFFYILKLLQNYKNSYMLLISTTLAISTFLRIGNIVFFPLEIIILIVFIIIKNYNTISNNHTSFSTIKLHKNLIRSFYFLIPWIIFLTFWFSYNDTFFGDSTKSYLEVKKEMDPSLYYNVDSFSFTPTSENLENLKIFTQYLLPYPLSGARTLETNYESILGTEWLGIISMILLCGILLYSFLTKSKRTEIFLILIIIAGIVWFYSIVSGDIDPNRSVPGRYMITPFVFTSFLFGFIVEKFLSHEFLKNIHFKQILRFLIIISAIVFFIFTITTLTPIMNWINSDDKIKNPSDVFQKYPLDKENLDENSIVISALGARVVDYDFIPFHPFLGVTILSGSNPEEFPTKPILLLNNLLLENHDVYTFKEETHWVEKKYLNYLVMNHNFVLKDFSKSFCKLELKNQEFEISDENCL